MPNLQICDFSQGMNTLMDERIIAPMQSGEPAESPWIENMDLTAKGAIITSPGISLVSSGAGLTGGTKNLMAYEKDASTRYLIITHGDDHYYITPSSATWTSVGDYGDVADNVGGVVYNGTSYVRRAILGNDLAANTTKKWDGTTFASLAGAPPDGWIMEEFMGRLFLASGESVYYSDVNDEDDFAGGGSIHFNDIVTGLKVQGESLLVFTRRDACAVQFYYNDAFSLSTPLKKPYKASSGCLAHKTLTSVYNDTYYLSGDGVQRFGADAQFIGQNLRVNSLSWKINPSITGTGINPAYVEKACGIYHDKKYYMAVPDGTDSFNSKVWVYNYDYDAWVMRSGIYATGFAIMPDSNKKDELYYSSCLSPDLYKFTKATFDYNGGGYTRKYKTKMFNMGDSMRAKFWKYIDLRGSMYLNTVFYVDVTVDGTTKTFIVDSNNLEKTALGGYYGDDYLGAVYFGGEAASEFRRYGVRIPFPVEIKVGRELQITIRNQEPGQPWSVDNLNIVFDYEDTVKIPTQFQTANLF